MPRLRLPILIFLSLLAAACTTQRNGANVSPDMPTVQLVPAFPSLKVEGAVWMGHDGAHADQLYVVEQSGRILRFENRANVEATEVFLDLSDKVLSPKTKGDREEGLLAMAFHPLFAQNGQFFVSYTTGTPENRHLLLSRFTVRKDGDVADPATEAVLIDTPKVHGNHNGGTLLFGDDRMLYVSYGDGGGQGDPDNNAQNLASLFGKILRLDVDKPDNGKLYGIPADNPFVNKANARPEIFAYGFRNPWRMSMDDKNLWVADVGQYSWESIDLVKKGENHGWSILEGSHPYKKGTPDQPITMPVVEYGHEMWRGCVIGGCVYRGERFPQLHGVYIYCDFVTGRLWGLKYTDGHVASNGELMVDLKPGLTTFGVDAHNELYACGLDGTIYRVQVADRSLPGNMASGN